MKKNIFILFFVVALLAPMLSFALETVPDPATGGPTVEVIIDRITNFLFTILLAAAVIAILVAGFLFLTAAGDPAKITKAQMVILYAIIAIVVAFSSKAIVALVRTVIGGAGTSSSSSPRTPAGQDVRQQDSVPYVPEFDDY